jgi:tRNA 2-selenouridine synthase
MRYPLLQSFAEILPDLAQFDAIIDTRSEDEFAEDHLPGAINCPVLDNEERIRVGTLYKQVNAFEAKKVGAALVARKIAQHIEQHWLDKPREWRPLVYCWRGGNRSGAMAHILAKIGWPVVQLEGGYKAWRQHVHTSLETLPHRFAWQVLCGPTGSGKSRLLQALAGEGAQVLDLEQLAAHRGSVLGHWPNKPQPSQKWFESRIWHALSGFDPARAVWVESESKKVGNLRVPDSLMACVREARCVNLALPDDLRVQWLHQEYHHLAEQPALLAPRLEFLTQLHGREKIRHWQQLSSNGQIEALIEALLREHYDPAYQRSIGRNFVHLAQAMTLPLTGIADEDWQQAARRLLTHL